MVGHVVPLRALPEVGGERERKRVNIAQRWWDRKSICNSSNN